MLYLFKAQISLPLTGSSSWEKGELVMHLLKAHQHMCCYVEVIIHFQKC